MSIEDLIIGARFLWRLPAFLRHPIRPEEARAILRRRLEQREADFLGLVKRTIYEHPGSPYRQLLRLAGCEYWDLEKVVRQQGVEAALRTLCREGVYLTAEEFKGYRPATRGGSQVPLDPANFRNPMSGSHLPLQTSGRRGARRPVLIDLQFIRDNAVDRLLVFDAQGGGRWQHAFWGVPGGAAMFRLLEFGTMGAQTVRWFSQIDPGASGLHPRYRWSARLLRWGSLLSGMPLPAVEYLPVERAWPIAEWMSHILRRGGTPHLHTFASSAVRVCHAALNAGIDLEGAHFTVGGEPVTEARLHAVRRVGATAAPRYAGTEAGTMGYGCLAPEAPDDVHLLGDLVALIQPGLDGHGPDLPPDALLFSSLRPSAPLVLLNVSLGDRAVVTARPCGCPLERLGWTTHVHTIRSFEKLTSEGMTFLDSDVIPVLEELLPSRFGGGPTDYQLVEEETGDGQARVRLLVHPAVGDVDPEAVRDAFLAAIGTGSGVERVMALQWRQAALLRVERVAPLSTAAGKVLHLHQAPGGCSSDNRDAQARVTRQGV